LGIISLGVNIFGAYLPPLFYVIPALAFFKLLVLVQPCHAQQIRVFEQVQSFPGFRIADEACGFCMCITRYDATFHERQGATQLISQIFIYIDANNVENGIAIAVACCCKRLAENL
jgi:SUMO ligase MMS21 Smc5/6 complex component